MTNRSLPVEHVVSLSNNSCIHVYKNLNLHMYKSPSCTLVLMYSVVKLLLFADLSQYHLMTVHRYCTTYLRGKTLTSYHTVYLHFISDGGQNAPGFNIYYQQICPGPGKCFRPHRFPSSTWYFPMISEIFLKFSSKFG